MCYNVNIEGDKIMIEKTVFENDEEIILYAKKVYGLEICSVRKINRGSANIYSLNDDKYILKEFQSHYTKQEIDKEVSIITHLKKFDIKVPIYIKTLNGLYYDVYQNKIIIIQYYIEGYTLNNNEGTYNQTIECADCYGKIVSALKSLTIELPDADLYSWYSKENFALSIKKHEDLLPMLDENDENDQKIRKDILEKIEMIKSISSNTNFIEMSNLSVLNTHGDYNLLQFIYKDGKINSVIDFVSACKMPIVWELIRSYSYIDKDAKDGEFNLDTFVDYVKTFNKYIKLNKYDLKYMAHLYLIQILNSTFGYKQYINNHANIKLLEFAYLRTNICRYLFHNATCISRKLEEELL